MAPPAADVDTGLATTIVPVQAKLITSGQSAIREPLKYSGSLDEYKSFDVTPAIGREFPEVQLTEILKDDTKTRDLAITGTLIGSLTAHRQHHGNYLTNLVVSERGVVFFRSQDITVPDQKALARKLGELSGNPETSKLHKHALSNSKRGIAVDDKGTLDDEISVISSEQTRKFYKERFSGFSKQFASKEWHSDVSFERIPSDYSILRIHTVPDNEPGGDTLWASGYEAYERLSTIWQRFAESLTATHHQPNVLEVVKKHGVELINGERGSPENTGLDFKASHPVVRTNPVTGWKSLYGLGAQVEKGWIDSVTEHESELIKAYFYDIIAKNHDIQVRFRWNAGDVAIWDNDYEGVRQGNRVVSIGEKPYYDPNSVSRREALSALAKK
ncbi:unnamed protein product [Clonostachys byssicola]|uniref:TauD/TfdA-like domain-containing protein n=1 Tax=Clonostachys byssicola TaxID=160290 RepID=A0A9N9Y0M1_9HYPO|nr:unnamed protein product [Clonostachys byssicola]